MAKTEFQSVPYKGAGPLMTDLAGGHVQIGFAAVSSVQGQVRANRVRLLGVGSLTPSVLFPDAPPIANDLPGFEAVSWFGLFVPASTPNAVVDKLYKDTLRVLKSPDVLERFAKEGAEPVGNSPVDFNNYVRAEFVKYNKVIKDNGIKAD
jgi:tripartite-type tricarboxylate transporter receptor subunit TctC